MIKIKVFTNVSDKYVKDHMMNVNFNRYRALLVNKSYIQSPEGSECLRNGSQIKLPSARSGTIVRQRRHVLWFWRVEYLVKQETEIGNWYRWVKSSQIKFK